MESEQCIKLVLRTCDGVFKDVNQASCTWNSIDLQHILGDDNYRNYDFFNITLVSMVTTTMPTSSLVSHDKAQNIYMSGLSFLNSTYNVNTKTVSNMATIGMVAYDILTTAIGEQYQPTQNIEATFKKSPVVDINISFFQIINYILSVPANSPAAVYPHRVFTFLIKPVKEFKNTCANINLIGVYRALNQLSGVSLFNGLNIKNIIGDLWDEYDMFNFELVGCQSTALSAPIDNTSKLCYISVSGLPFVESSYDFTNKTITPNAICGIVDLSNVGVTNPTSVFISNYNSVRFSKFFAVVDLKISLISVSTGTLLISTGIISNLNFLFKITGVKDFEKNI